MAIVSKHDIGYQLNLLDEELCNTGEVESMVRKYGLFGLA